MSTYMCVLPHIWAHVYTLKYYKHIFKKELLCAMNKIIMTKRNKQAKNANDPPKNDFCLKETKTESEIESALSNAPSV